MNIKVTEKSSKMVCGVVDNTKQMSMEEYNACQKKKYIAAYLNSPPGCYWSNTLWTDDSKVKHFGKKTRKN